MTSDTKELFADIIHSRDLSPNEREEMMALGILSAQGVPQPPPSFLNGRGIGTVAKRPVGAPSVLNEAYGYHPIPSSFSRGLRVDLKDFSFLFISGTSSVDEKGQTVHAGDFRAQCWRTYRNITALLDSEGATWNDVVRCTCYLRDIERDYKEFNQTRTAFFRWQGLDPLPASVGIQARLCRSDLLVEIDALALLGRDGAR